MASSFRGHTFDILVEPGADPPIPEPDASSVVRVQMANGADFISNTGPKRRRFEVRVDVANRTEARWFFTNIGTTGDLAHQVTPSVLEAYTATLDLASRPTYDPSGVVTLTLLFIIAGYG